MIIARGLRQKWGVGAGLVGMCLAIVAIAGCGPDGRASVNVPPGQQFNPLVTGVVSAPAGMVASATPWWQRVGNFQLVATAYGGSVLPNPSVFPISGVQVSLSLADPTAADHGEIRLVPPFAQAENQTDDTGSYTILQSQAVDNVGACGLMVSAFSGAETTHAFVLSAAPAATNIDVVSETVVRIVLDRLTKAPAVDLCENFSDAALQTITEAVSAAVFTATGLDAADINQVAFDKASSNPTVQAAVDFATGVPVTGN